MPRKIPRIKGDKSLDDDLIDFMPVEKVRKAVADTVDIKAWIELLTMTRAKRMEKDDIIKLAGNQEALTLAIRKPDVFAGEMVNILESRHRKNKDRYGEILVDRRTYHDMFRDIIRLTAKAVLNKKYVAVWHNGIESWSWALYEVKPPGSGGKRRPFQTYFMVDFEPFPEIAPQFRHAVKLGLKLHDAPIDRLVDSLEKTKPDKTLQIHMFPDGGLVDRAIEISVDSTHGEGDAYNFVKEIYDGKSLGIHIRKYSEDEVASLVKNIGRDNTREIEKQMLKIHRKLVEKNIDKISVIHDKNISRQQVLESLMKTAYILDNLEKYIEERKYREVTRLSGRYRVIEEDGDGYKVVVETSIQQ